jgi:hypothetical protein
MIKRSENIANDLTNTLKRLQIILWFVEILLWTPQILSTWVDNVTRFMKKKKKKAKKKELGFTWSESGIKLLVIEKLFAIIINSSRTTSYGIIILT